jgi:hypothetical protein
MYPVDKLCKVGCGCEVVAGWQHGAWWQGGGAAAGQCRTEWYGWAGVVARGLRAVRGAGAACAVHAPTRIVVISTRLNIVI